MLQERFASHLRARDANGNYITSDEKLLNYLQDPGTIPSILVLGEVERRQVENKQRQQMQAQAAGPMPTVKDQALMQQANAQNMMMGGIDNLGAQRPDMTNVPQPTEMAAAERANMPGLPALAKAGGYVSNFKGGGVVGYAGDEDSYVVKGPFERGFLGEARASDIMSEIKKQEILKKLEEENKKDLTLHTKPTAEQAIIKEKMRTQFPEFLPDIIEKQQKTDKEAAQDKLLGGLDTDTNLDVDRFRFDKNFDEMRMDDPAEYRARMEREREEALGPSPFGEAIEKEASRSEKAQARKKDFVVGEFLMNLGNAVGQQIPGQALDLTRSIDRLSQGNKEYFDMIRDDERYALELQKLNMAEKDARFKFGVDSEERARINNQKVGLEAVKTQIEYDKMANELKKAGISASAYRSYIDFGLKATNQNLSIFEKIEDRLKEDNKGIYNQIRQLETIAGTKDGLNANQKIRLDELRALYDLKRRELIKAYEGRGVVQSSSDRSTVTTNRNPVMPQYNPQDPAGILSGAKF